MEDKIAKFQELINKSNNIVFFGGAGVSTESGVPDFRSKDGLYNQKYKYPPEVILSSTFFWNKTEDFYDFYKNKMNALNVMPNITHKFLAELEKAGKLKAIVTQNIDGLHQKAGSKVVYELHGSVHRNYCVHCQKEYDGESVFSSSGVPKCTCGHVIKPDVVLYGESLDDEVVKGVISAISKSDLLIIGGTSLNVYPAAGLVNYYSGENIVLINKDKTPYDNKATLVINEKLGDVFSKIKI